MVQEQLRSFLVPMRHLACHLNHPFFLRSFVHGPNMHIRPDLQAGTPSSQGLLYLLTKGSPDTIGVGSPSICTDEEGSHRLTTSSNLLHQRISQGTVTGQTHRSCQPEPGGNHHR